MELCAFHFETPHRDLNNRSEDELPLGALVDVAAWHRYFTAAVFKWVMMVRVACLIYLTCICARDWRANSANYKLLTANQSAKINPLL